MPTQSRGHGTPALGARPTALRRHGSGGCACRRRKRGHLNLEEKKEKFVHHRITPSPRSRPAPSTHTHSAQAHGDDGIVAACLFEDVGQDRKTVEAAVI